MAALPAVYSPLANEAPNPAGVEELARESDAAEQFEKQNDRESTAAHDAVLQADSVYLDDLATGDAWRDEVDAIQRDLSRMESELGLESQSKE